MGLTIGDKMVLLLVAITLFGRITSCQPYTNVTQSNSSRDLLECVTIHTSQISSTETGDITTDPLYGVVVIASEIIVLYINPVVTIGGTICNTLSFLVMLRPKLRSMSISVYLLVLAISDTCSIWWDNNYKWTMAVFGWAIPGPTMYCNWRDWGNLFFPCCGAWLIVCVTIERLIAVQHPLRASTLNTVRNARIIVTILTLFVLLMTIPKALGQQDVDGQCIQKPNWAQLHLATVYFSIFFFALFPSCILIIANTAIIYSLRRSMNKFQDQSSWNTTQHSRTSNVHKITKIVITVSITYVILTSPGTIGYVYGSLAESLLFYEMSTATILSVVIGGAFYYLNCSINFFLYVIVSGNFRAELKDMFKSCCCVVRNT